MRRFARTVLLLPPALLAAACGESGTGPGGGIPITISATWNVEGDDDRTFFFRSPDDGAVAGLLTGRENDPESCPAGCPLGGHWEDGTIWITILRQNDLRPKFRANVSADDPTRITFQQVGGSETFTVIQ